MLDLGEAGDGHRQAADSSRRAEENSRRAEDGSQGAGDNRRAGDDVPVAAGSGDPSIPVERRERRTQSRGRRFGPDRRSPEPMANTAVVAALNGRRLLVALALALLIPTLLGVAVLRYQHPDPPPTDAGPSFQVLPQVPDPDAAQALKFSRAANRLATKVDAPTVLDAPPTAAHDPAAAPLAATGAPVAGVLPTLALAVRARPYSLKELTTEVPSAFAWMDGPDASAGSLLVKTNLLVPVGATLVIDGETPDVRLTSSPAGFSTIISHGTLTVAGDPRQPVHISSWDPVKKQPDRNTADGRSFVLQTGGRMDLSHGVFQFLGFDVGSTSGVAWIGPSTNSATTPADKARGDVTDSKFLNNHFGAYTRLADSMHWLRNTFADNDEYGFDPHDFSNNFLVEGNTAYGNGKHGFIFSRGCINNILRYNIAHDNAGHGFMIDDGRSTPTEDAATRVAGSDNNVVVGNYAFANAGNGVEIEGGTGNVVGNNRLLTNYVGVRVKDQGSVTVRDNSLINNLRYGIDVRNTLGQISVTGNTIEGSWGAVNLAAPDTAALDGNVTSNVSTDLVVGGVATRDITWLQRVGAYVYWNPMLLLWSLVLGLPILIFVLRLFSGRTLGGGRISRG